VSAESGNVLIWNRVTQKVLFKEGQPNVRQIALLDGGQRFLAISRPSDSGADVTRINATLVTRTIPGKPLQSSAYGVQWREHQNVGYFVLTQCASCEVRTGL
jgi:hypothetical protein